MPWFVRLASTCTATQTKPTILGNFPETDVPVLVAPKQQQNSRYSLSHILNPINGLQIYSSSSSDNEDGADGGYTSESDLPGLPLQSAIQNETKTLGPSLINTWQVDDSSMNVDSASVAPISPLTQSHSSFETTSAGIKRKERSGSEDDDSTKYVKAGNGTSRSAIASRNRRQLLFEGSLKVDKQRYATWQAKVLALDDDAEFDDKDVRQARHSVCGKVVTMKDPYDITRPSLFKMGWLKKKASSLPPTPQMVPCPGLTAVDHPRITRYLQRTGTLGGGGRSLPEIAKETFKCLFSALKKDDQRQQVVDAQQHEWRWRNDHAGSRVYSTVCEKHVISRYPRPPNPCGACAGVLKLRGFRNILHKKIPEDKNFKFVNERFRNSQLGLIYARTLGVQELIEDEDSRTSPFVRYALGALDGTYDNEVFNGLLQAMVTRSDKAERGVGLQNFSYAPAWEELCHIIQIHSPRAYDALQEYLPMPTRRNLRMKEAHQPRFPMSICEQTFELVADHLQKIGYNGPVGLSCDDTKLFATFRLYWDSDENEYFLVGATEGPIKVLEPESVRQAIEDAKAQKATKIRLWGLSIPIPKVAPVIVAAHPIHSLDADALLKLHMKIVDGLLDHDIFIVSYACDGTEVERNVQKGFLERMHKIEYTIKGCRNNDHTVVFGTYRGTAICNIQDSKHALKTMRNNLFSGARLLVFGNFVALYRNILNVALGEGTPLFSRDVVKLDRQDDNAAVRLFSAATLQYLADHHPECVGEIVYLFIFGELIDAFQNRRLQHAERLKMVLRARYFLKAWETYLNTCGYQKARYFISREANDILHILIDGFIALIIIHRDHLRSGMTAPLLPWLHSSEACEHIFGSARNVVKDFTFLDFIYMIPKLRIKLHEAVLRGKTSTGKARAAGYSHTYFDHEGLDFVALSTFPTDGEIVEIAESAFEEAEGLVALLGVSPEALLRNPHNFTLPAIQSWLPEDSEESDDEPCSDDGDDSDEFVEQLQHFLDTEENSPISRRAKIDKRCLTLTSAALALITNESTKVQKFSILHDDEIDRVAAEEYIQVQEFSKHRSKDDHQVYLPAVQLPDQSSRPFGAGILKSSGLDFSGLVELRRQHQTKHAMTGVRKQLKTNDTDTIRLKVLQQFHSVLRTVQDDTAVGTGVERGVRWRVPAAGGRDGLVKGARAPELAAGNSANAATAATAAAKKAALRRRDIFTKVGVPNLRELVDARVTAFRPLQLDDYGFVMTEHGVMLCKVVSLSSKTGGKNGKHSDITESSNISAISLMGVQIFQRSFATQFTMITESTSRFQTKGYLLVPSTQFLCLVDSKIQPRSPDSLIVGISPEDLQRFQRLRDGEDALKAAMKGFRKRADDNFES